jgi:hypothetical protein
VSELYRFQNAQCNDEKRGENCSQSVQVVDKCFRMAGIFTGCTLLLLIRYVKRIQGTTVLAAVLICIKEKQFSGKE